MFTFPDPLMTERDRAYRVEIDRNLVIRNEDIAPTLHARVDDHPGTSSATGRHSNE